eukprot:Hpha_TRINITY_DN16302_c3_g1::TRINITY_DN16302_c3_g1_i1::g.60474::m.60474
MPGDDAGSQGTTPPATAGGEADGNPDQSTFERHGSSRHKEAPFMASQGVLMTSGVGGFFVRPDWSKGEQSPYDGYKVNLKTDDDDQILIRPQVPLKREVIQYAPNPVRKSGRYARAARGEHDDDVAEDGQEEDDDRRKRRRTDVDINHVSNQLAQLLSEIADLKAKLTEKDEMIDRLRRELDNTKAANWGVAGLRLGDVTQASECTSRREGDTAQRSPARGRHTRQQGRCRDGR